LSAILKESQLNFIASALFLRNFIMLVCRFSSY